MGLGNIEKCSTNGESFTKINREIIEIGGSSWIFEIELKYFEEIEF